MKFILKAFKWLIYITLISALVLIMSVIILLEVEYSTSKKSYEKSIHKEQNKTATYRGPVVFSRKISRLEKPLLEYVFRKTSLPYAEYRYCFWLLICMGMLLVLLLSMLIHKTVNLTKIKDASTNIENEKREARQKIGACEDHLLALRSHIKVLEIMNANGLKTFCIDSTKTKNSLIYKEVAEYFDKNEDISVSKCMIEITRKYVWLSYWDKTNEQCDLNMTDDDLYVDPALAALASSILFKICERFEVLIDESLPSNEGATKTLNQEPIEPKKDELPAKALLQKKEEAYPSELSDIELFSIPKTGIHKITIEFK